MRDVSGVTGAAPIWADVMSWLHRDLPSDVPPAPPEVRRVANEWFVAATEPVHAEPVRAEWPRIVAPTDGTVIAIDPDIPATRQRVGFEAVGDGRWILNGTDVGSTRELMLWSPSRGVHALQFVDAGGRQIGSVRFEVR
jgi:penicillin-binding protein 1C